MTQERFYGLKNKICVTNIQLVCVCLIDNGLISGNSLMSHSSESGNFRGGQCQKMNLSKKLFQLSNIVVHILEHIGQ